MKIAKALVILFALVLVVVCFNTPAVYSYDEDHPWDEDNGGGTDGEDGSYKPDSDSTEIVRGGTIDPGDGSEGTNGIVTDDVNLWLDLQFLLWYFDLPGKNIDNAGQNSNGIEVEASSTNAK